MKTKYVVAAVAAAFSFAGAASAAPADGSTGHYEWRQAPSYGPRAPLAAPRRVWVAGSMAQTDCPMMHGDNAAACRAMMPGKAG
ncbi:hypothetical protein AWL63_23360 (plasmid) [Sphingomonas panacis]|uniref:Uncharacterized protein n=1 Tax=Sphingomonas panacis TaxID=1560345 RepID=A0A1B3ZI67_9SPHN|nr:hypothetical protein [Sphingomonas panacis]AOH87116.1 hypothetical protein AWL63_23360 [Sphingomonas panacis]